MVLSTKDTDEAAFLWCQNSIAFDKVECKHREGGSGFTVFFIFNSDISEHDVSELRKSYYNCQAKVEPKQFAAKQLDIRNILHAALRQQRGV